METDTEEQFVEDVQNADGGTADVGTAAAVETAKPVDLEAAIAKLGDRLSTELKPKETAAPQQMSREQEAELWAIYNPEAGRKDFMHKFFKLNPDATAEEVADAKAMWGDMQKGLVRQAVVGSRNLFMQELQKVHDRYAPLETHYREARAEKLQRDFYSAYPALGVQTESGTFQFQTAIRMATNDLAQKTFNGESEYFKALADRASEIIKGILPSFDLGAKTKNKTSTTTPSLPRTRVGGSGGTAAGGGTGDGKSVRGANGDDASTLDWNS